MGCSSSKRDNKMTAFDDDVFLIVGPCNASESFACAWERLLCVQLCFASRAQDQLCVVKAVSA
jgi:hypothetical protein